MVRASPEEERRLYRMLELAGRRPGGRAAGRFMDVAKEHMELLAAREEGAVDGVRWRQMIGSEGRGLGAAAAAAAGMQPQREKEGESREVKNSKRLNDALMC